MTRRDRTTGLPVARRGRRARTGEGGGLFSQRLARFAVIGTALAALLAVAALLAYNWFDSGIATPGKVVLRVGEQEFTLSYYAARLPDFAQTDPSAQGLLATQALLNKLEEEGLAIVAAAERGIALGEDDVTGAIAAELGVPPDPARGGLFDTRYREALRESGMSDGHYRQRAEARETDRRLREALREEVGETGALVEARIVTVATLEEAEAVRARIGEGEDMGTIAQLDSLHEQSRQNDGLLRSPPALLGEALREALAEAEAGALLGPLEADGVFWVVRLEGREAAGAYTDEQIAELTERSYGEALDAARSRVTIERDFTTDDANWAIGEAS